MNCNYSVIKKSCNKLIRRWKSLNSDSWLERRARDPYLDLARINNYRCRSAFKLLEIDSKYKILRPGMLAVDLGAAPGSWTQVLVRKINADGLDSKKPIGKVIAIDRHPISPINHATIFSKLDFRERASQQKVLDELGENKFNIVVSDMAPNASGTAALDQEAILELAFSAVRFAVRTSATNATCLVKIWDGGGRPQLERHLAMYYKQIHHVRPKATQNESTEMFLLARGFKS